MAHKRAGADITSTSTEPRKALHTLVISADDALARACAHILEYGGMRPRTVNSLEAAAAYLSDRSIDDAPGAIVVDYHSLPATGVATLPEIVAADQESPPALIILGGTDELMLTDSLYQVFGTVQFANTPPTSRQLLPLLPAFDRDCSGPATRLNELDDGQAVSTDRPTIKALLADDNHINRRLARIFLDQLGVEVDEAKTGAEVLALSRCRPYDIILMDIHMPDLDGLEATRQLRGETDNPNRKTPVIALTADALGRERQRCLAAGMNGYLCKPITEGTLQQLLGKWCPAHPEHMRSTDSIGIRTTVTS
jgi:CheY-like chemotaxis protein